MRDAFGVRLRERGGDLYRDVYRLDGFQRRGSGALAQRHAVDVLACDELRAAFLAALVDRDDVRVVQLQDGARLLLEAAGRPPVPPAGFGQGVAGRAAGPPGGLRRLRLAPPAPA